jgi:hypothetical protein
MRELVLYLAAFANGALCMWVLCARPMDKLFRWLDPEGKSRGKNLIDIIKLRCVRKA